MTLWIDADACPRPVREIMLRAARRRELQLVLVAMPSDRFDEWAVKSGLADAIDLAFRDLASSPPAGIDDHVPY